MSSIQTIGLIGAGRMGGGIAQVCAQAGFAVRMTDIDGAALSSAIGAIHRGLDRQIAKGRLAEPDKAAALERIATIDRLTDLGAVDLVIEAVTEDEGTKRQLFEQLKPTLKDHTLVASGSSSLSITRLAAATGRPTRFMGMHFMNPVPEMPLVELIRGVATADETVRALASVAARIGKTATITGDFPAFIVNRVLMSMINEAVCTLYQGVGSVEEIDRAIRVGAGHPMGPLELADYIGLDVCLSILTALHTERTNPKYRPCPLLVKYVEAGWTGRKAGCGFYNHATTPPTPTR